MESSILVNRDLREVNLEGEELNEEDGFPISVKIEEKSSPNDGTSGDAREEGEFTEFFGVSKEEGQRLPPPCSCQEEIESLKCTVKQLTFEMQKQSEAMKKQNEVITGIKSCIRNAAFSMLTGCEDKEELGNDLGGRKESGELSKGVENFGSIDEDSEQLKNSEVLSGTINEAFQDEEQSPSIVIVKCTGGGDAKTMPFPGVSCFSPFVQPETRSNEVGSFCSWAGQNTEEEETAAMADVKFQDDDDKDSSYVPDKSEDELDSVKEWEDDRDRQGNKLKWVSHSSRGIQKPGPITKEATGFDCSKCGKKNFKAAEYLRRHTRNFHSNRPMHKCHLCSKVFRDRTGINRHIQSVHEGVRYKCTYCPGKFSKLVHVRRHEKSVHEEGASTQKCQICGIHLLNLKCSLQSHMNMIHKELGSLKPSQKKVWKDRKPKLKKLRIPRNTSRATIYQCQLCPVSFSDREELQCHRSQVHGITAGAEAN